MRIKIKFFIVSFLILLTAVFFSYRIYKKYQDIVKEQVLAQRRKEGWLRLEKILKNKVANFKGTAGIVIEDLDTQRKIVFNEEMLIPSASLVKVPIMLSCFYAAGAKKFISDVTRLTYNYYQELY